MADVVLTISEHTRSDAIKHLGLPPVKVINVGTGVDPFFQSFFVDQPRWERALGAKFGIDKKFIFYTGGTDWRKNIAGLVESFARLPEIVRGDY